jgi:hypothetical protein
MGVRTLWIPACAGMTDLLSRPRGNDKQPSCQQRLAAHFFTASRNFKFEILNPNR